MVNGRFTICKKSSTFMRCSRMESRHIKNRNGINLRIYLVVNEYDMPINFVVTIGACADCKEAIHSIKNIDAKLVFSDRAYSTNEILYYLILINQNVIVFINVIMRVKFIAPIISLKILSLL